MTALKATPKIMMDRFARSHLQEVRSRTIFKLFTSVEHAAEILNPLIVCVKAVLEAVTWL